MKFTLEIGEKEKHLVEFNFNQLLGTMVIKVNQKEVKKTTRLINEPVLETHAIQIGDGQQLNLRIEKERKLLFGQKYRVFLNERLYQYYEGM